MYTVFIAHLLLNVHGVLTKGEGLVTETGLVANLGWEARRAKLALDQLVGSNSNIV